ncbi:hypothetical protein [Streptosporangium roseum]|uniref:hypothetical protein n=1 Tax=Streptosporangium roseum TaxID=2001 RepID=UPI0033274FC6
MEQYPRESIEYVYVVVEGSDNLDTLPVVGQIQPYGIRPDPSAWETATWGVDADGNTAARILIGPGTPFDFSTAPGTVIPWAQVTADPELPLLEGTPVQIT